MDEAELLELILNNVKVLTCFNCGEKLIDRMPSNMQEMLGVIRLDKGSRNYPDGPDDPAGIYFECLKCRNIQYP